MHTLKYSKKREAILDALRSTKSHPSAEWVYAKLKPLYPDLSLGTVYRNLSLFRGEGQVISIGTVNGQERFDAKTNPHPHFICDVCGEVIDVSDELDLSVIGAPQSFSEGIIQYCDVTFHGKCLKCMK
jgi:Fur family peroxide stress response transcriptional regulator